MVPGENLIWENTTWDACRFPCCCLAPMCCSATHWTVTTKRIDKKSGCCGTSEDTADIRRITDLKYTADGLCCCCRGTVEIFVADNTDDQMTITTWGTKDLYHSLKEAWSLSRGATAVDVDNGV